MAGNRYDSGQGADRPHGGWSAPPPPPAGAPGGYGETDGPEYFTAPHPSASGAPGNNPGGPGHPAAGPGPAPANGPAGGGYDPYAAERPGSTRAFPTTGDPFAGAAPYPQQPYGQQPPYGHEGYHDDGYGQRQPPPYGHEQGYGNEQGYGHEQGYRPDQGYGHDQAYGEQAYGDDRQAPYGQDNVAVYRAGGQSSPHVAGPRPQWRELVVGLFRSPTAIFDRTRDHQVWLPALTVSLLYGALAVLGIGLTHDDIVNSTFTVALTGILAAAVGFTVAGAIFGGVTYALARQLGGDGPWKSTVGLAALIGWLTDAPRLLLDLVLPSGSPVVQVVGWATWMLCAYLLASMVRRLHDLPWGKAAAASALQLLALLVLIKLPTLG
ncbi:Yip1 family protein [Kitasatospora sp. NPDC056446]|uniref:Yip1 family protein n=1 Tax=Kitasatospora sp. NPDC056446 TaxID=3345819 RepID=UPI003681B333